MVGVLFSFLRHVARPFFPKRFAPSSTLAAILLLTMTLSFLQCLGQLEKTSEGIVADAAKFHRSLGGGGETAEAHDSCQGVPWRRARAQATLHRMDTTLEGDQLWAAQWQKVRCGAGQGETNHLTSAIPPTQRRDTMAARRRYAVLYDRRQCATMSFNVSIERQWQPLRPCCQDIKRN